jgi:hypothetical protein
MASRKGFGYKGHVLKIKRLAFLFFTLISAVIPDCATAVPPRKLEYPIDQPGWFERSGDRVQRFVEDMSEKLDVTLAGRKYKDAKKNETKVKITQTVVYREGGRVEPRTHFTANVRLPHLERRWQLRFTSYDEDEETRRKITPHETVQPEREFSAGVGVFRELGRIKVSFLPRLVLRDPLEMNYVIRFEKVDDLKPVRILHRADLFAHAKKGTGQFYELTVLLELSRWTISSKHQEEYRERDQLFTTAHSLNFDYKLFENTALYQATSVHSLNRPTYHLDTLNVACGIGHVIQPRRLKLALGPTLSFPKSAHFKGQIITALTAELMF